VPQQITLDGRTVAFAPGQSVLDVARANGIRIPTLCHHRRTGPAGRCRVCIVEVEGHRGLPTSCTLPARDGMVVRTSTEPVLRARRTIVNLLLSNGEHHCLSCRKNGTCELQDVAYELGIEAPAFLTEGPRREVDDSSEMIVRDPRKCILCGRCVAACSDVVGNEVLGIAGKGFGSRIVCDLDVPLSRSTCVQCGECVQACPVGAIVDKKTAGKSRSWQTEAVDTTCPYCGVGCQVTLHVDRAANRIVRVTGREVAPNDGMLCVKGRYGYEFPSSRNRLTTPMIRKDGKLEPVSWDEALDFTARRLGEILRAHGPDSFSAFGSGRLTNENNYAIAKFTRAVVKTNNVDNCART
jgi:formate dehydrogenase major subunit